MRPQQWTISFTDGTQRNLYGAFDPSGFIEFPEGPAADPGNPKIRLYPMHRIHLAWRA